MAENGVRFLGSLDTGPSVRSTFLLVATPGPAPCSVAGGRVCHVRDTVFLGHNFVSGLQTLKT